MKHRIILLVCASIFFNFQLSTFNLVAQPLPQGYFRNPMNHDIGLSATFAEFRSGHFHSGLDLRTGGAVDQPVYAALYGNEAGTCICPARQSGTVPREESLTEPVKAFVNGSFGV